MSTDSVREAVKKVALGYTVAEVTEEFSVEDGELKLVKRKETKKEIPPDLKAAKLLLDENDFSDYTDERLLEERKKLLAYLNGEEKKEEENS